MRSFILSFPPKYQLFVIVACTILFAFVSSGIIYFCFNTNDLISKAGLITSVYTVLGTIYAVFVAFSISGVWQNYCASEIAVTTEAAALMDLVHMVKASVTEKAAAIRALAIDYITQVMAKEWSMLAKGNSDLLMSPNASTFALSMQLIHEIQTIQPVDARDNVIFTHALTLLTKWLDARRTRIMISKGNIAKSHWPLLIVGAFILFAFHGMFIFENPVPLLKESSMPRIGGSGG